MKILQIASGDFFSTYGGGQVYVKNIADEMISQGVDIVIVSSVGSCDSIIKKEYKGVDLYEIPSLSDESLANLISKIKPDIIHAHSLKAQMCRVGRSMGIPVVVTAHHGGILCPAGALMDSHDRICDRQASHKNCLRCCLRNTRTGIWWYPAMRLLPRKAYIGLGRFLKRMPFIPLITPIGITALSIEGKAGEWRQIADDCTMMIAPSHAIAEAMRRNGLPADKIRVVPHGIPAPTAVKRDTDEGKSGVSFFYLGRISYIKGIHVMLEAFSKVKDPDARLHIIGDAVRNDEIRYRNRLQKKYAADRRIVWHGKVAPDRVFDAIKDFDVSITPTICLEVFGLNVSESISLGIPVLATRSGGPEMQIADGVNGWLVEPNDPDALATKITEIAGGGRLSATSTKNHSPISIANHCRELQAIYADVLQKVQTTHETERNDLKPIRAVNGGTL